MGGTTPWNVKETPMKKKMAAGLAAGLLAGTGAGLILEISGSAGASSTNVSAIHVAADNTTDTTNTSGTTDADTTKPDPSTRLQEVLKPLVDDGTLTQAQADKVVAALAAAGPIGGDRGGRGGHGPGANMSLVATTLGMTEAEVRDAISNGQTLAQLAESKGSTGQALIDVLVAAEKTRLDAEVAAGEHTQAEADTKLADATTRITDFVNNTQTAGPGDGGPGEGGPGGHHGRGPGDNDGDGPNGTNGTSGSTTPIDGGPTDNTTATGA